MRPLLITLYVIGIILIIYIILVIIIGLVVRSVKKHIDRKEHAVTVLMAQKYDLVKTLVELMKEHEIPLPENVQKSLQLGDYTTLKNMNTAEKTNFRSVLFNAVSAIFFIAEDHQMGENSRYLTLKHSIREIDEQYRKDAAIYNAQVMAYNYWIHFFIFRPVAFICRMKKKENLF